MESRRVKFALSPASHNSAADQVQPRASWRVIAGPPNDILFIQQYLACK